MDFDMAFTRRTFNQYVKVDEFCATMLPRSSNAQFRSYAQYEEWMALEDRALKMALAGDEQLSTGMTGVAQLSADFSVLKWALRYVDRREIQYNWPHSLICAFAQRHDGARFYIGIRRYRRYSSANTRTRRRFSCPHTSCPHPDRAQPCVTFHSPMHFLLFFSVRRKRKSKGYLIQQQKMEGAGGQQEAPPPTSMQALEQALLEVSLDERSTSVPQQEGVARPPSSFGASFAHRPPEPPHPSAFLSTSPSATTVITDGMPSAVGAQGGSASHEEGDSFLQLDIIEEALKEIEHPLQSATNLVWCFGSLP